MANLPEPDAGAWGPIYQIAKTDKVVGGSLAAGLIDPVTGDGVANKPSWDLLLRIVFLRELIEAMLAATGREIADGESAWSSDGHLMRNASGGPITLTGTTRAEMLADGLEDWADHLAATQAEVNAYSAVGRFVTPDLLQNRTMDTATLTQTAQAVAYDTLTRMFYSANGGAAAFAGDGANRWSFSNGSLTLSKDGWYAVRGLVWQASFVANAGDIYVQVNKDAAVMCAQTGGAGHNLWGCWAEAFAVFQGAAGEVLTLDSKQVNGGATVRNLNAALVVSHIS